MRRLIARIAISVALLLIALVAAVVALIYFAFALYLWLATYFAPPLAAIVSGLIVLVVALLLALIARAMMRGPRRRDTEDSMLRAAETAADVGNLFRDNVHHFASQHRGSSMLTALLAGFVVGVSPKLRATLWRIFKKLT